METCKTRYFVYVYCISITAANLGEWELLGADERRLGERRWSEFNNP